MKDATSAVANVDDYTGSARLLAATTLRKIFEYLPSSIFLIFNICNITITNSTLIGEEIINFYYCVIGIYFLINPNNLWIFSEIAGTSWAQRRLVTSSPSARQLPTTCKSASMRPLILGGSTLSGLRWLLNDDLYIYNLYLSFIFIICIYNLNL